MRNAILVLLTGPILFGCLDSGEPTTEVNNGFAGGPVGNRAPTISGNPPTGITYGDMYEFKPNASDPDGDRLTFSVDNRPDWASFDSSTGEISGQPTLGDIGVYDNILISASDGNATSSLRVFSVTVSQTAPGNSAPTISGNPPTEVTYGDMYKFKPTAVDPDGDRLTFSVDNRPGWASFNSSTGEISGQPTLGDVGVYDNILISASDGNATSSLRVFSITVSQTALGTVTLSWVAPTENSDGSALMDLAGYKIYYRKGSGSYVQEVRIDNPSISTYVVDQLSPDTYYFAATAFNTSGVESSFSAEVARTVN